MEHVPLPFLHLYILAVVLGKDSSRRKQSLGQGVGGKWDGFECSGGGGLKQRAAPGIIATVATELNCVQKQGFLCGRRGFKDGLSMCSCFVVLLGS